MSQVSTNEVGLSYCIETSLGVPSTLWKQLEPNTLDSFGAEIATVARQPISADRQRKKGTITDLDSTVEFGADLTMDHFLDFAEGFAFAVFNGPQNFSDEDTNTCTGIVAATDHYTVEDNDTDNPNPVIASGMLVYVTGCSNSANNGVKTSTGGSATTITVSESLVDETPPSTIEISVCGVEGATGDIDVDANGNLTSTVLDFTTLGLTVGQGIWVGGAVAANQFTNAENTGFARVTAIAANLLTLDKKSQAFVVEADTTQEIHLLFGRYIRNVTVDDADYLERSFQFEMAYPDLEAVGTDAYEYAKGNYCNSMQLQLALSDKALTTFGFTGTDTPVPTTSRASGAATALVPQKTVAFNTSSDIARLRLQETDETGLSTYFKSLNLTMNNNVTPEKVLGTLGAVFMNTGNFEIDIEAQLLFTDPDIASAVRSNTTVTMDFSIKNDDGGVLIDIPSMTLGGGDKEYPVNETVLINTTAMAFKDATLGTSIGISFFPYLP